MFLTGPAVVREVTGETRDGARARRPARARPQRRLPLRGRHRRRRDLPRAAAADLPARERVGGAADVRRPPSPPGPTRAASCRSIAGASTTCATAIDGIVDADSVLEASPRLGAEHRHRVRAHRGPAGRHRGQPAAPPRRRDRRRRVAEGRRASCAPATPSGCRWSSWSTRPASCPAPSQESIGVIRHGAKLLHAFAEATVPRFTVVLRKAFGGAYITMNSKDLGADLYLAWSRAELGIMGAEQAVGVVHRRALAARRRPGGGAPPAGRRLRRRAPQRRRPRPASAHVDEVIRPARPAAAWPGRSRRSPATRAPAPIRNIPL